MTAELLRLRLNPGDVLVVRVTNAAAADWTESAWARVAEGIRDAFGPNQKVIVTTEAIDFERLTPEGLAALGLQRIP